MFRIQTVDTSLMSTLHSVLSIEHSAVVIEHGTLDYTTRLRSL